MAHRKYRFIGLIGLIGFIGSTGYSKIGYVLIKVDSWQDIESEFKRIKPMQPIKPIKPSYIIPGMFSPPVNLLISAATISWDFASASFTAASIRS